MESCLSDWLIICWGFTRKVSRICSRNIFCVRSRLWWWIRILKPLTPRGWCRWHTAPGSAEGLRSPHSAAQPSCRRRSATLHDHSYYQVTIILITNWDCCPNRAMPTASESAEATPFKAIDMSQWDKMMSMCKLTPLKYVQLATTNLLLFRFYLE